MQGFNRRLHWRVLLVLGVFGLALVAVYKIALAAGVANPPPPQQEVIRLETRINQLEQRLYSIDSSIRNLEQQSRIGGNTSRGVTAQDIELLRSQIQALQVRLSEDECNLARLDERTLSAAMRNSRRQSNLRGDPCRVNVDAPLRLPERGQ
jgi:predicted RNase H-like nuclease (RuvC/YqgF family)